MRRWIDPLGTPTDPLHEIAWATSKKPGWPDDAVDVLEILVNFTHHRVLPLIVPDFERILDAKLGHDDLVVALRVELRAWRDRWHGAKSKDRQFEMWARWWSIERDVLALQSLRKAQTLLAMPREDWTGKPPLTLAREGARRCGEALSLVDNAEELIDQLPGDPLPAASSS